MNEIKRLIVNIFSKWMANPIITNAIKIVVGIWAMLSGIHNFFYGITFLIIVDVITGIVASMRRGEKFSSKKLRRGLLERFCIYNVTLIIVWVVEKMIMESFSYSSFYGVMVVGVMIASYEVSSTIENLISINPEFVFLKRIGRILNLIELGTEKKLKDSLGVEEVSEKEPQIPEG